MLSIILLFTFISLSNIKCTTYFRNIKKIDFNNYYFVVLTDGLYLYNNNLLNCSKIFNFNSSIYKNSGDKIILTKLEEERNSFILCLINKYLFIYDAKKNKIKYHLLNDKAITTDNYCNLMPYKINDNLLSFIFVFSNSANLNFYYYDYNFNNKKIELKNESAFYNLMITSNRINCQINSYLSYINCFSYYTNDNNKYLLSTIFSIDENNLDIIKQDTYNYTLGKIVNEIKSVLSFNNKFFICLSSGDEKRLVCYINVYNQTSHFEKMGCTFGTDFKPYYKMFFFNETGNFIVTARYSLETGMLNSYTNEIKACSKFKMFPGQSDNGDDYSIIFNNTLNEYKLLNYLDFKNSGICEDKTNLISQDDEQIIISSIPTNIAYTTENLFTTNIPNTVKITQNENDDYSDNISNIINNNETTDYFINNNYGSSYNIIFRTDLIIPNIIYKKEVTNKTKEEIFSDINNVLKDREIGVNYEIKGEDFTIIIKPTNSTPLPNTTYVEFDECEQIIRKEYNISDSSIITFLQIEIDNDDQNSLYNQIKYFTYDDQMRELDLSICGDLDTKIHYAIKNNSNLDISSISDFQQLGIDILNIKDEFFNDLCFSYSDSNNDMILEDRIKYLYQNYSLCESGCTYNNIDIENMNIACICKIKGNDNESFLNITPLFFEQPKEASFFDSNIGVVKCYNLVFSMNNKGKNIGFIVFSILFLFYIIFMICYCRNGIEPVKEYLLKEMTKNGYLKNKKINNSRNKINNNSKKKNTNNNKRIMKAKNNKNSNPIKKQKQGNKNKRIRPMKIKNNNSINLNHLIGININKSKNKENSRTNSVIQPLYKKKSTTKKLTKKVEEDSEDMNNFGIVKMNLNNYKNYFPKESNQSLHNYTFDEAIKYDKRNIFRIAYIYLLSKQIIFRTFLQRSPIELYPLRFILFIFMFSCDFALNALFYFNDNISKKYHYAKNLFLLAFSSNITIIIYSTLVSYFLITLLNKLSNSSNAIRNVFTSVEQKIKFNKKFKINDNMKKNVHTRIVNILDKLKIKIAFLFLIETILILFFWYFVTAFCHVYSSTQTSWLLDSFLSILSRLIIELIFSFLYGKLYQISVASNFKTLYKIVMFFYDFNCN